VTGASKPPAWPSPWLYIVALVVALLDDDGAGVTKVPPFGLIAQLILGHEAVPEAKRLVQRLLCLSRHVCTVATTVGPCGSFLWYGPLLGLPPTEPLGKHGLDVLGRRGWREGELEEPPGHGPH
jgi:hypothetical protein